MLSHNLLIDIQMNRNQNTNIDRLRNNYWVIDFDAYFKSLDFGQLQLQKDYLLVNSKLIQMEPAFEQKPEHLSQIEYDTPVLAPVIMFMNDCFSRMDFIMDEVYVPNLSALESLVADAYQFFNQDYYIHSREFKIRRR